ncbi:hypothetical protein M8494_18500 [Serratia ureilytica]
MIGTDGRNSVRPRAGGAQQPLLRRPRDVLWMKLSKQPGDPAPPMGHTGPKQNFISDRSRRLPAVRLPIDKGSFDATPQRPGEILCCDLAEVALSPGRRLQEIVEGIR